MYESRKLSYQTPLCDWLSSNLNSKLIFSTVCTDITTKIKTIVEKNSKLFWVNLEEHLPCPSPRQGKAKMSSELNLSLIKTSLLRLYLSPVVDCLSPEKSGTFCRWEGLMWLPSKTNSEIQPQLFKLMNDLKHWYTVIKHS